MADVMDSSTQAELRLNGRLREENDSGLDDGLPQNDLQRFSNDNIPEEEATKCNNPEKEDQGDKALHENEEETTEKHADSCAKGMAKKRGVSVDNLELPPETKKRAAREPSTPTQSCDRPARERKSIDRFVASVERDKVREFKVEKGNGSQLKDIPNVVYKLSKKTGGDESLQQLHKVLFAKRAKPHTTKQNILQFSGYAWSENKAKEKAKAKERLEKCVRDSLFQISDLLDMNLPRSSKKEDLVDKLLVFLESPQKLTDQLVEEKQQKLKEKKKLKSAKKRSRKAPGKTPPRKRQRSISATSKKVHKKDDNDEEEVEEKEEEVDEQFEEEEESSEESDDEDYEVKPKKSRRGSSKKLKRSRQKSDSSKYSEDEVIENEEVAVKQESEGESGSDSDDEYNSRVIESKITVKKASKKILKEEATGNLEIEDRDMDGESQDEESDDEDYEAKPKKSRRGSGKKLKRSRRKSDSSKYSEDEVVENEEVAVKQESEGESGSDSDDEYSSRVIESKIKVKKASKKIPKEEASGNLKIEDRDVDDKSQDEEKSLEKKGSEISEDHPKQARKDSTASKDSQSEEQTTTHKISAEEMELKNVSKNESKASSMKKRDNDLKSMEEIEAEESKDKANEFKPLEKAKGKPKDRQTKAMPSDEELREAICNILKEADFSTVTFANALDHLETQFNTSLAEIKAHVKSLIREEISKLEKEAEEEEEEGEEEDAEGSEEEST